MRRVNRRIPVRIVRFCRSAIARRDVLGIGLAGDERAGAADALAGAVLPLCRSRSAFAGCAVQPHRHRMIHARAEGFLDGLKVRLVTVAADLDATGETARQIGHERLGSLSVASPTYDEGISLVSARMAVQVQMSPAPSGRSLGCGNVVPLRVAESPNLVELRPFARQVPQHAILVVRADPPGTASLSPLRCSVLGGARWRSSASPISRPWPSCTLTVERSNRRRVSTRTLSACRAVRTGTRHPCGGALPLAATTLYPFHHLSRPRQPAYGVA